MQLIRVLTMLLSGAAMVFILWLYLNRGRRRDRTEADDRKGNGTTNA